MANLGFLLRGAFGLIPKTEKIEEQQNTLQHEFDKLNSYADSEELKEYNQLKELINSDSFKENKNKIVGLDFKKTEEYQKELNFNKLKKNKGIINYYKVESSQQLSDFNETEQSDELKNYLKLKEYLSSPDHTSVVNDFNDKLTKEKDKAKQQKTLSKSKNIKDYFKALNSSQLK
ncbi:MAG: hypothetical protein PF517_07970, partial [Salinivirgaceae bacterium]|nr:hypothetical protein [Salinivirgaceae bacterium]